MQRDRNKPIYKLAYVYEYLKDAEAILSNEALVGHNGRDISEAERAQLQEAVLKALHQAAVVMQGYYRKCAPVTRVMGRFSTQRDLTG